MCIAYCVLYFTFCTSLQGNDILSIWISVANTISQLIDQTWVVWMHLQLNYNLYRILIRFAVFLFWWQMYTMICTTSPTDLGTDELNAHGRKSRRINNKEWEYIRIISVMVHQQIDVVAAFYFAQMDNVYPLLHFSSFILTKCQVILKLIFNFTRTANLFPFQFLWYPSP